MQQVQPRRILRASNARNLHYQYSVASSHRLVAQKQNRHSLITEDTGGKTRKYLLREILISSKILFSLSSATLNFSISAISEIADNKKFSEFFDFIDKRKRTRFLRILALTLLSDIFSEGTGMYNRRQQVT